jgi:CxxC motif-containing protein
MGFGDIGLIMARRLMLEGIHVRMIFGEQANGLVRNYIQCVREFGIESKAGYTLVSTHGYKRLKGVTIAPKTEEGEVLLEQKEYIPCDTLLVAAGLVPEDELFQELAGEHMQADDQGVTQIPGIFACGNVTEISDLVDKVTMAGIYAGNSAAAYLGRTVISMEELFAGDAGKARQAFAYHPTKMNGQIPEPTQFVCTICPNGCVIQKEGDHYTGHKCERGAAFARDYAESGVLKTILTTTVKVAGGQKKLLAVRTDTALSRQEMEALMPTLQKMTVTAPIEEGTVIMTSDAEGKIIMTSDAEDKGIKTSDAEGKEIKTSDVDMVNIVATETIYVNE